MNVKESQHILTQTASLLEQCTNIINELHALSLEDADWDLFYALTSQIDECTIKSFEFTSAISRYDAQKIKNIGL
jgi:hypothetical protein